MKYVNFHNEARNAISIKRIDYQIILDVILMRNTQSLYIQKIVKRV